MKKITLVLLVCTSLLALVGCNLPAQLVGGDGEESGVAEGEPTLLPTASPTPFTLAPTLPLDGVEGAEEDGSTDGSVDEDNRAPTPLPEPTPIPAAGEEADGEGSEDETDGEGEEEAEEAPAVEFDRSGIGLVMDPNLGEPTDVVLVIGFGFEPGEEVVLYWAPLDGERGAEDARIDADSNGEFERLVMIPPADEWPNGPPAELDYVQMRAYAPSLAEGEYYFANFRYIPRFGGVQGLVLFFENPDFPYSVEAPNAWTWEWDIGTGETPEPADDVRFRGPNGETGFIRVFNATNVDSVIAAVMDQEFDANYTTETATVGAYPGTQAVTDGGNLVLFIPANGFVYAVSFSQSNGQPLNNMLSSFRINQ